MLEVTRVINDSQKDNENDHNIANVIVAGIVDSKGNCTVAGNENDNENDNSNGNINDSENENINDNDIGNENE